MRVAFYAPLKPPNHAVPSGDRRVGRLFMDALARAGHEVDLVSTLRTHEPKGDPGSQARIRAEGTAAAQDLIARWKGTSGSTIRYQPMTGQLASPRRVWRIDWSP